jgi:hypothetical protein
MNKTIMTAGLLCLSAVFSLAQGAELSYTSDPDTAYTSVLNQLKKEGFEIESASKDAGIKTAPVTVGRFKQTNTYIRLTLLPEEKKFRVVVYGAWRMTPGSPWSPVKANEDKAAATVLKLKDELHW